MRKIGVILCTRTKKEYPCNVVEMYKDSILFHSKYLFAKVVYDEWYVSTRYGFIAPHEVIEPYDFYIKKVGKHSPLHNNGDNIMTKQMIDDYVTAIVKRFPNPKEIELHCHLSNEYYKKLKSHFPNIINIKQQVNYTATAWRYYDATIDYLNGKSLEECLENIQIEYRVNRPKEEPKWFYHNEYEPFFGKGYNLAVKYNIDNGCSYSVSMGESYVYKGWTADELLLPYIEKRGKQYRLTKKQPKIDKSHKRLGLREKLVELENKINEKKYPLYSSLCL
jgi:hypothetical protein